MIVTENHGKFCSPHCCGTPY